MTPTVPAVPCSKNGRISSLQLLLLCFLSLKKKSSVENKHEWVRKQVMPTIAGLLYAYGGDMSAVFGDLGVQFNRNSLENREMFISAFNNLVEVQEDERSWLR